MSYFADLFESRSQFSVLVRETVKIAICNKRGMGGEEGNLKIGMQQLSYVM